ncbi:MAG: hypothetical protein ACP5H3_04185 [Candidatus Aenigmatarchaeota archaeon]
MGEKEDRTRKKKLLEEKLRMADKEYNQAVKEFQEAFTSRYNVASNGDIKASELKEKEAKAKNAERKMVKLYKKMEKIRNQYNMLEVVKMKTLKIKSKKTGIIWRWSGGHEIKGYINKKEVALLNFGDFSKDITPEEAEKKLKEIANESPEEQLMYAIDENAVKFILKNMEE